MCVRIQAQSIAANALIQMFEQKKTENADIELNDIKIEFSEFSEFELHVLEAYESSPVIYISLCDVIGGEYLDYTRFFDFIPEGEKKYLKIQSGITIKDLYEYYGAVTVRFLEAILSAYEKTFNKKTSITST